MNNSVKGLVGVATLVLVALCASAFAGGPAAPVMPPLDDTLMGFKEHGAWYFFCDAPTFCQRIPPHYLTYGPPPPPYCPPPMYCAPPPARRAGK